jgi:hypothetical protein
MYWKEKGTSCCSVFRWEGGTQEERELLEVCRLCRKKNKKRTLGVFCGILFHVAISGNCGCTWNLFNNKLREGVDET